MAITEIIDGIISLIKINLIAKTNVVANVVSGSNVISVENSFNFENGQEIVLIDNGFNDSSHPHYRKFEYSKIKKINNTNAITLTSDVIDNWTLADKAFIQKTIAHSPLYDDQVLYGDRDVIPSDQMAIAVEPSALSNEWMYIQGGLSEEYRAKILIYGKDITTDDGRRILDKYSDETYNLLNHNLHIGVGYQQAPLHSDALNGDSVIVIEDTQDNRENFVLSSELSDPISYKLQDNLNTVCCFSTITDISISNGYMYLTVDPPVSGNYYLNEYAVLLKLGTYIYDSRVDSVTYGVVSKGSAVLRASELSWFGKLINKHSFPQKLKNIEPFTKIEDVFSSSSSSSSSSS